jgi:hypothetical protein
MDDGIRRAGPVLRSAAGQGQRVFVVGNRGGAGIASQITGRAMRALAFGDGSALTGLSAAHGCAQIFACRTGAHAPQSARRKGNQDGDGSWTACRRGTRTPNSLENNLPNSERSHRSSYARGF